MPLWTDPGAARIWRAPAATDHRGDLLGAPDVYTDAVLARIAAEGFTGIWLFARLYDLMHSTVFPELNRPQAGERRDALQTVVERARWHGLGVYLYFNDPVSVDVDDPFWQTHADLKGVEKWHSYALCTSVPVVQHFFREAVASVFAGVHGVAGVILITACESLTHCWSKSAVRRGAPPPTCPRCREREPADLVLELLESWVAVSRAQPEPFRVIAWNWEWAYWYPDPQAPIVTRLPAGVELLLDLEIGGTRQWLGRPSYIGEYALSYVGPSERLVATQDAVAGRDIPTLAKLQLNTTHEFTTVPNVPVLHALHAKFAALVQRGIVGFLGTWTIGTRFTLNTFALKLFLQDPVRFMDADVFLGELARQYLGVPDPARAIRAWAAFSEGFTECPFSVNLLYFGPHNDAPARTLSLQYQGRRNGRSYMPDELGDDLSPVFQTAGCDQEAVTLDEVVTGYSRAYERWHAGLPDYEAALASSYDRSEEHRQHCREELVCAWMVGHQLRATRNVYRFYREQQRVLREHGLTAPCRLPPDPALLEIMADELANARCALVLAMADERLGYHEEFGGYKYDAARIQAKITAMAAELAVRV